MSAPGAGRPARREEGPFHASFVFGRVAGVEIGATWSWLIVVGLIVWQSTGDFTRATRICGALGRLFGNGLVGLGVFLLVFAGAVGGLWLILMGFFLSAAAQAEASLATTRATLGGLKVRDAMVSEPDVSAAIGRLPSSWRGRSRAAGTPPIRSCRTGRSVCCPTATRHWSAPTSAG